MGMSRYTALVIKAARKRDLQVFVSETKENGKYSVSLWRRDYSPSGCERPDLLLSTDFIFKTKAEAKKYMDAVVKEVRSAKTGKEWGLD